MSSLPLAHIGDRDESQLLQLWHLLHVHVDGGNGAGTAHVELQRAHTVHRVGVARGGSSQVLARQRVIAGDGLRSVGHRDGTHAGLRLVEHHAQARLEGSCLPVVGQRVAHRQLAHQTVEGVASFTLFLIWVLGYLFCGAPVLVVVIIATSGDSKAEAQHYCGHQHPIKNFLVHIHYHLSIIICQLGRRPFIAHCFTLIV